MKQTKQNKKDLTKHRANSWTWHWKALCDLVAAYLLPLTSHHAFSLLMAHQYMSSLLQMCQTPSCLSVFAHVALLHRFAWLIPTHPPGVCTYSMCLGKTFLTDWLGLSPPLLLAFCTSNVLFLADTYHRHNERILVYSSLMMVHLHNKPHE